MTPDPTILATLAHHHPLLPPPIERDDGGIWYAISVHTLIDVTPTPDGYRAILTGADCLGLARPRVEAEAPTPEAAVAAAIEAGAHILSAAAYASAQQARTLAAILGTSLPTEPAAAQERLDHVRRAWSALRNATEAAEGAYKAAQASKAHAETMLIVEAALPGLTGPAHADRVALLRTLAPSGWHRVNGNHTRWLQSASLVDARRVTTAYDRHSRPTASHTEASLTEAGRLAISAIDAAKGATQ